MRRIIVFDVNETLLDLGALEPDFRLVFGDALALREWFGLLLHYSAVSSLAGPYFDFATLAAATLNMTASSRGVTLPEPDKRRILARILTLPPHQEAHGALQILRHAGLRLVALTNSSQEMVEAQLTHSGLSEYFERRFSADLVRRYKPAPEPYRMVADMLKVTTGDLRLVAAHAWDLVGAMQAGCAAAFVSRPGKVLFPLTPAPDIVGKDLRIVAEQIVSREALPE